MARPLNLEGLPLRGVRVVDLSHMVAGPYCTMLLGFCGAEVIKVESAARPDGFRLRDGRGRMEHCRQFAEINRNKYDFTVNLKADGGRELLLRLIARSDVVVENFSAGVLSRLGLEYEALRAVRPDLIAVSLQALGRDGPDRDHVAYGPTLMPLVGASHLWNDPAWAEPVGSQSSFPDYVAALYALVALLAALHWREATGEGQYIEIAQSEALANLIGPAMLQSLRGDTQPAPRGNAPLATAVPSGCYPTRQPGRFCFVCAEDDHGWAALCRSLGISAQPNWETVAGRMRDRERVEAAVARCLRACDPDGLAERLQAAGVAASLVEDGSDLCADPHLADRGFLAEADHPFIGPLRYPGVPLRFERTPARAERTAPLLGEDNDYVLRSVLGLSAAEARAWVARGVVV